IGSIKRKFEELESICSVNPVTVSSVNEGSIPLAFYREEVPGGSPNYQIPLLELTSKGSMAELFVVSSTIHLKMKYYTKDGQVATINGDIAAARRCFEAATKNLNTVVTPKKKKVEQKMPAVNSIGTPNPVDLDA
ncbi:hypothetical protein A2U01_0051165, partial [Trifolium medium]|nr:hypothetical protein [Trifolium medium]